MSRSRRALPARFSFVALAALLLLAAPAAAQPAEAPDVAPAAEADLDALTRSLDALSDDLFATEPDSQPQDASPFLSCRGYTRPVRILTCIWKTWVTPLVWLTLVLLAIAYGAKERRRWRPDRDALVLGAIVLLGVVVRLAMARFGPGCVRHPLWEDIFQSAPGHMARHGTGLEGLFRLLALVFPPTSATVAGVNLLASAALPVATACFVRNLGMKRWQALGAAAMVAFLPLHIRFSMTDSRFPIPVLLTFVGWNAIFAYAKRGRTLGLPIAFLALTLVPQCRPEMALLSGFTFLLLLLLPRLPERSPLAHRTKLFLGAMFALHVAVLVWPLWQTLTEHLGSRGQGDAKLALAVALGNVFNPEHNAHLATEYTPLLFIVLGLAGVLAGLWERRWTTAFLVLGAVAIALPLTNYDVEGAVEEARYHLTGVLFWAPLWAAGLGLAGRVLQSSRGRLVLVVIVVLSSLITVPDVVDPRTMNVEFDFLRENLEKVPEGCRIAYYRTESEPVGYHPSLQNSMDVGRIHDWTDDPETLFDSGDCAVLYRGGACFVSLPGPAAGAALQRRMCEDLLTASTGVLAEASAPARGAEEVQYREKDLTIGLYWLQPPPPRRR